MKGICYPFLDRLGHSVHLRHIALMIKGGSPEFIDTLIKHGVDVNETWLGSW
jgi:hypothetical protein